jgi:hypothetical protein
VPAFGSLATLKGRVLNGDPKAQRVAVLIYVPEAGWWSKPTCASPLTAFGSDGSWAANINTGSGDKFATRITALLVGTNYAEPCVEGAAAIPPAVLAQARASVTVRRTDPAAPWLDFSGYEWVGKSADAPAGPGPNYFSVSTNNVWLDAAGRLHLRITHRDNRWQCAEVLSFRSFGYGSYRFYVDSVMNDLDANVVLGLFTWSNDPAYAHREIDFEFARWDNAADSNNAQFVVQPFDTAGHLVRYRVPAGLAPITCLFKWETNRVSFQSLRGHTPLANATNLISQWVFSKPGVPVPGDEKVHLNLWLGGGRPPRNGQEAEVILSRFEFVPLAPPQAAHLRTPSFDAAGAFQFSFETESDRRYDLEASGDLSAWERLTTVLATGATFPVSERLADRASRRFYRVITLP